MPSGAVSPAEPVAGWMVAKLQPLPARRRLAAACQQLISPMVGDERKDQRHLLPQYKTDSYNTHLSATPVPALRAGRGRLVSGGNRASDTARVWPEMGTGFQTCTVFD